MADGNLEAVSGGGSASPVRQRRGLPLAFGLIFGFLGLSVLVHAVAVTHAFTSPQELVRSDYYEAGERQDLELAARRLGAGLVVTRTASGALAVELSGAPAGVDGAAAVLRWQRPSSASADRAVALAPGSAAGPSFAAQAATARAGPNHRGPATPAPRATVARWLSAPQPSLPSGAWRVRLEVAGPHPVAVELPVHVDADGTVRARKRVAAAATVGAQP